MRAAATALPAVKTFPPATCAAPLLLEAPLPLPLPLLAVPEACEPDWPEVNVGWMSVRNAKAGQ